MTLALSALVTLVWGQKRKTTDPTFISKTDLRRSIRVLSSQEHRMLGSKGQKAAAAFIAERYGDVGLEEVSPEYLQKFDVEQTAWGEVYLETSRGRLNNFEEMIYMMNIPENEELEKTLVFAGRGTDEELDQVDVEDRVVFVFTDNLRAIMRLEDKLTSRGAYAVILANPDNERQFEMLKNTQKEFRLAKKFILPGFDTYKITHAKLRKATGDMKPLTKSFVIPNHKIKSLMGSSVSTLKKRMVSKSIDQQPTTTIKLKCEKLKTLVETENVVGKLKGRSGKAIVLTAHYDHIGNHDEDNFPGADDNASGVAALLALAQKFSQEKDLEHDIIFIATSGEEAGLLGSKYYVNREDFDANSIVCNLNMDMIGRVDKVHEGKKGYLYCLGTDVYQQFADAVKKADKDYAALEIDYGDKALDVRDIYSRSDHFNFHQKMVPALQFFSGLHDDYHRPTDTMDKIDFELLQQRTAFLVLLVKTIQNM